MSAHSYLRLDATLKRVKTLPRVKLSGRHSYLRLGIVPAPLRLLPQPLEALPKPQDAVPFETDHAEARRVAKILAILFARAAASEPISQATRDKLGITTEDISAIADKVGKARAAEIMGLKWMPDGSLEPDPSADMAITNTTETQVNAVVDKTIAALEPGDTWAPGQGPNDTTVTDAGLTDDETLALAIAGLFAFSQARPEMVADMETGVMQNMLALTAYEAAGVTEVLVLDGEEFDAPCILADGQTWSIAQAMDNPKEHPNAIMAGTRVLSLGPVRMAYRARWNGPLTSLATRSGNRIAIGPNHPVLTKRGWIPAKAIRVGDYVVSRSTFDDPARSAKPNLDDVEPVIEDVFETLSAYALSSRCASTPTHFHGDGNFCEGEIDVIRPYRLLEHVGNTRFVQMPCEGALVMGDVELEALACESAESLLPKRLFATAGGGIRSHSLSLPLFEGQMRGAQEMDLSPCALDAEITNPLPGSHTVNVEARSDLFLSQFAFDVEATKEDRVRTASDLDAVGMKATVENLVVDSGLCGEFRDRLALDVAFDEVVEIGYVDSFVGHAFDLSTESRTYFANGILTHNCVRSFLPLGADGMQLAASKKLFPLARPATVSATDMTAPGHQDRNGENKEPT